MEPTIFVHNMKLTPRLEDYVGKRTSKLQRYLPNLMELKMELSAQNSHSATERHSAQLTLRDRYGTILRAEERHLDIFTAIDAVVDKMYRQIKKYRGKHLARRRQAVSPDMVALDLPDLPDEYDIEESAEPEIVREKRFAMSPMSPSEAISQMELLGHDFYVFFNMEEEAINVLYRRRDGDYGILMPELA